MKTLLAALSLFLATAACAAPSPFGDAQVKVSFEFPDHTLKATTMTNRRGYAILRQKPLDKEVWVDDYKIDWWVFAALQELDLPFKTKTTGKTGGPWEATIIRIGEFANGPLGSWVFYVNGIKSRYHISTQLDQGVREIRFVFEPEPPAPDKRTRGARPDTSTGGH